MKLTNRYKRLVLEHLEQKYNEKGMDFYFKSKKLSKDLNLSKYVIGRIIMEETKKEKPRILLIKNHERGPSLYRTEFKECII